MKITMISVLNFLGIASFKTTSLGKLNIITGDNETGKSSLVNAIKEAFKSSGVKPKIIKGGNDRAEIFIELDERILVERRITRTANQVKVVVDGQPLNAPQKYLNDLIGPLIFNPVEFFLTNAKERRRMLLSSIPISIDRAALVEMLGDLPVPVDLERFDYSGHGLEVLERIQRTVYERRHEQNLEVTRLKKSLDQDKLDIPDTFDGDRYKDFDIQDKIDQLTMAKGAIALHKRDAAHLKELRARSLEVGAEIDRLRTEIKRQETLLVAIQSDGKELAQKVEAFEAPDMQTLEANITEYNQRQKLILKLEEIERKEGEIEESAKVHSALDDFYKALTTDVPRKLLSKVQLPADNLEIKGNDILVDGVSLDTFSDSQKLLFSLDIARSLVLAKDAKQRLKFLCVDRFESLSPKNRRIFEKATTDDDFEYFVTVVTDGPLKMESVNGESATRSVNKPTAKQAGKQVDAGF